MVKRGQVGVGTPNFGAAISPRGSEHKGIYKVDGTPIRNPVGYLAKTSGDEILLDSNGNIIRDPTAYVLGMVKRGDVAIPASGQGSAKHQGIFKADGTPIKNPRQYVKTAMDKGGIKETLYDSYGKEI